MKIEEEIQRQVVKKAFEKLNVDAIVTRALPQIERQIQRAIENGIENLDWQEIFYDHLPVEELGVKISNKLRESIRKLK